MPFSSPLRSRERILLLGHPGSGKSSAHLNIAKLSQLTNSPSHFHILDTDAAIDRMLDSPQYSSLRNITTYSLYDWPDYTSSLTKALSIVSPDDWIVVDMIGQAWDVVQSYFAAEVFRKDIADYFLAARQSLQSKLDKNIKTSKGKDPTLETFEGWVDWTIINSLYKSWVNPLILKSPCHVLAVTKADSISRDSERDAQVRQTFGPYGVKPQGQKALGFQFHTVLLLSKPSPTTYSITSIKDRERELLSNVPLTQFSMTYLKSVAKWEVVR